MDRRAFLAGAGAVGVGAVGVGIGYVALTEGSRYPYELRVVPGEENWTEVRCSLDPDTVQVYPKLTAALEDATDVPTGEEVTRGLTPEQASDIRYVLAQCDPETTGNGLYQYDGEWYLVGVVIVDPDRIAGHHQHNHTHNRTNQS